MGRARFTFGLVHIFRSVRNFPNSSVTVTPPGVRYSTPEPMPTLAHDTPGVGGDTSRSRSSTRSCEPPQQPDPPSLDAVTLEDHEVHPHVPSPRDMFDISDSYRHSVLIDGCSDDPFSPHLVSTCRMSDLVHSPTTQTPSPDHSQDVQNNGRDNSVYPGPSTQDPTCTRHGPPLLPEIAMLPRQEMLQVVKKLPQEMLRRHEMFRRHAVLRRLKKVRQGKLREQKLRQVELRQMELLEELRRMKLAEGGLRQMKLLVGGLCQSLLKLVVSSNQLKPSLTLRYSRVGSLDLRRLVFFPKTVGDSLLIGYQELRSELR